MRLRYRYDMAYRVPVISAKLKMCTLYAALVPQNGFRSFFQKSMHVKKTNWSWRRQNCSRFALRLRRVLIVAMTPIPQHCGTLWMEREKTSAVGRKIVRINFWLTSGFLPRCCLVGKTRENLGIQVNQIGVGAVKISFIS
jgi:hypothetical protein